MPQASREQRELMRRWFGSDVSEEGPVQFLIARGWTDKGGVIKPPVPSHQPSQYELECVYFLCDEWDYAYEGVAKLIPCHLW